jgi:hypothetical protein
MNDAALERAIRALLDERKAGATICPSDVARAVGGGSWRKLMQPVRDAAARLVERGELVVTQKGKRVDIHQARGPVRLGRTKEAVVPSRRAVRRP